MEYLSFAISVLSGIISGMVLFFLKNYFNRREEAEKEKEKAKVKENILILKSINALGKLTYADSIAIRDGKTNGELKDAFEDYEEVRKELYEYLLEQNARNK
jgi:hypothetical protein